MTLSYLVTRGDFVGLVRRMPKMKTKLFLTALVGAAAFSVTTANAQVCNSEYSYETVYFNHDSSSRGSYETQVQNVANSINACGGSDVQIVCHTDTSGSAVYNQGLSERRAEQMFKDLLGLGVSSASISSRTGEGETNNALPLGDGVKEEANRRCNITIRNSAYAPVVETYSEPAYVESYSAPVETYTEVVNTPATPIESTTVTTTVPSTPEPITTYQSVPSTTYTTPSVASAPVVSAPVSAPTASLPTVSAGGGFGSSLPILLGGVGAAAAIGYIAGDSQGDVSDEAFDQAVAAANTASAQAQEEAADRAAAESALADSQAENTALETTVAELEAENNLLQDQLDGIADGTISP